jgi:hypothetical protein
MSLGDWEISQAVKRIRERIKARHQELVEMEQRAGIHEKAEALRNEPPDYFGFIAGLEWDSDERRRAETAAEEYHADRTVRKIRELYFSVADVELRKALIGKDREEEEAGRKYWEERLSYEIRESARASPHWPESPKGLSEPEKV